ncbi:MAG: DUF554 domain-containing protein [Eubacteriales bacterium]|jgi:uncharacterized membrane protein YqgA involved in biofilm formation|nr:DUF554 domain-containing protein [Eubacteriales bacterium]
MRGLGTLVNAGAVLLGGGLGLLLKKGIPQRVSDAVMKALGLAVLYLGLSGAWDMEKPLVTIASLAIGTAVGTALKLDDRVGALAQKLTGRLGKGEWKDGMVTATLLFCVGAMGITGALTDGLTGDHSILFTKAFLDGISACFLASAMGAGVLLSAGALLAYQGLFTLLGVFFSAFFAQAAGAMGAVGSLLLVPIAFNMMGLGKFRVMEYVPAVFMPLILYWIL